MSDETLPVLEVGKRVLYVPHHANGDTSHPDCEVGIVSSWRAQSDGRCTVWVRYHQGDTAAATDLHALREAP